ncbi:MAG: flagellar export chaperone FlgN [Oscillospiraceae bacterium]
MLNKLAFLIQGLTECYSELNEIEAQKRSVLITLDFNKLNKFERKEQPLVLKARGLEVQRQELCSSLGYKNKNLEDVVKELTYKTAKEKQKIEDAYLKLKKVVLKFRQTMEENNKITKNYNEHLQSYVNKLNNAATSNLDVML